MVLLAGVTLNGHCSCSEGNDCLIPVIKKATREGGFLLVVLWVGGSVNSHKAALHGREIRQLLTNTQGLIQGLPPPPCLHRLLPVFRHPTVLGLVATQTSACDVTSTQATANRMCMVGQQGRATALPSDANMVVPVCSWESVFL